jgi:hypothetical protein
MSTLLDKFLFNRNTIVQVPWQLVYVKPAYQRWGHNLCHGKHDGAAVA